jgi:sigma-E factor negative regulatory protein RseB
VIRSLVILVAGVGVWLGGIPAYACTVSSPGSGGHNDAGVLLKRAMRAASETAYSGVQWLAASAGSRKTTVLLDVHHVPGHGSTVAPVQTSLTGGQPVLDPAPIRTDAAAAPLRGGVPGAAELGLLETHYRLDVAGFGEVADRPARVIEAHRAGADGSLAARWWLDRGSDLVLRSEVFAPGGRLVRSSGYVTVTIGSAGAGARPRPAAQRPAPRPVPSPWSPVDAHVVHRMRGDGFAAPERLGRRFVRYDARAKQVADARVLHLSYSDGLSTLSVFEQAGRLDPDQLAGFESGHVAGTHVWRRGTMPRQVVWAANGTVYTVVTDGSPAVVRAAVRALPHASGDDGVLTRIQHGFTRMGSWLNPFD